MLEGIFAKSPAEAFRIMMHVHESGLGVCGAYPYEIAETKVALVHERARGTAFRCGPAWKTIERGTHDQRGS